MKINKNKYPLKKVIERDVHISGGEKNSNGFYTTKIYANRLECGHFQKTATDFYGDIHSEKQRCRQCYEELTAVTTKK